MKSTRLAHLPVELLWEFREFKRDEVAAPRAVWAHAHDVEEITAYVREHGVAPLELSIVKDRALLTDGNHRIVAARRLGYREVPVKVTVFFGDGADRFYQHTLDRFRPLTQPLETNLKYIFL